VPVATQEFHAAGPGARRRLTAALLAVLALIALPISHGLALHHVDHDGTWIAGTPDGPGFQAPDTGDASAEPCPLCLAKTSSGSFSLPAPAETPAAPLAAGRLAAVSGGPCVAPVDLRVAGPRAPPTA
jgi:hypothetical protein